MTEMLILIIMINSLLVKLLIFNSIAKDNYFLEKLVVRLVDFYLSLDNEVHFRGQVFNSVNSGVLLHKKRFHPNYDFLHEFTIWFQLT